MQSTTLNTILARMDRYQDVATIEEQYKVRDIDEALRTQRRAIKPPWAIRKTTLRVFTDVLVYSVPADHDYLAYLDNELSSQSSPSLNGQKNAYFRYTSLEQFYENADGRNKLVDIWDSGNRYLGVRYFPNDASSALVSSTDVDEYTASGDASGIFLETVVTQNDTDSIGFVVTSSSGVATIQENDADVISDTDYKRKYYFRSVYLTHLPTSVQLRWGNSSSNYLYSVVTTQFSGAAFVAGDWNLLAFDLNTATTVGTLDDEQFDYQAVILNGAASGTYYLNNAYLRSWHLMDYWYYSKFNVATDGSTVPDQQFFFVDSTNEYSGDDALVGDSEWIDVITFDAILTSLSDNKNRDVINAILAKRTEAWTQLMAKYPDMAPVIITSGYNFSTDPNYTGYGGGDGWGGPNY